jgi:hypothetical protein
MIQWRSVWIDVDKCDVGLFYILGNDDSGITVKYVGAGCIGAPYWWIISKMIVFSAPCLFSTY